jgi:hypothetical protein
MKFGILVVGVLIILAALFVIPGVPGLASITYVTYGAWIIGGLLVLVGAFGKKKF